MTDNNDILEDFLEFSGRIKISNPQKNTQYMIRFVDSEFTSICPITGQPDFAHLMIDYIPDIWLMESKSLKFYLSSFSDQSIYQEDCIITIGRRLADILQPHWLRIGGYWYPRGSIPIDVFWQTGEPPKSIWIPDQDKPFIMQGKM